MPVCLLLRSSRAELQLQIAVTRIARGGVEELNPWISQGRTMMTVFVKTDQPPSFPSLRMASSSSSLPNNKTSWKAKRPDGLRSAGRRKERKTFPITCPGKLEAGVLRQAQPLVMTISVRAARYPTVVVSRAVRPAFGALCRAV